MLSLWVKQPYLALIGTLPLFPSRVNECHLGLHKHLFVPKELEANYSLLLQIHHNMNQEFQWKTYSLPDDLQRLQLEY